jgi:hypothetical protein
MVGRIIRTIGAAVYDYHELLEDTESSGPFGRLKIALIADYFTAACLSVECRTRNLTPANYKDVIDIWKPDLVFVESTFHGAKGSWRYELAKQPKLLRLTRPKAIFDVVEYARSRGIPTVFWNKDDGAFFEAFIDVAKAFDHVFTTDERCLVRYRRELPRGVSANVLMMPYQPRFHSFDGFHFSQRSACFVGSYYRQILNERRRYLDMMFETTRRAGMDVHVFDRNHKRLSRFFEFRFPSYAHMIRHPAMAHHQTGELYKKYLVSLNVNSVTDSPSMISRRLLEILACGGIAVTNRSLAVDVHFRDFCHVIETQEQAIALFSRLKHGPSPENLQRAEAGAAYVRQHHTWTHRLEQVCAVTNI